ncbi:MAG: hypothetical protein R3Y12_00685 [Clostridia bacterium]
MYTKNSYIITYEDEKKIIHQKRMECLDKKDLKDIFYKLVYILPNVKKGFVWEIYGDDRFIGLIEKDGINSPKIKLRFLDGDFSEIHCKNIKQP